MSFPLANGGYVIGVGIDIIEVERVRRVHEGHPERFLNRIFTEEEKKYCLAMKNPFPHLAARFAAKEAVSKAFTTGIGKDLGWKSISVYHGDRGEPLVRLDQKGLDLLKRVQGDGILLSLSHTANYGNAVAVIVKKSKSGDDPCGCGVVNDGSSIA